MVARARADPLPPFERAIGWWLLAAMPLLWLLILIPFVLALGDASWHAWPILAILLLFGICMPLAGWRLLRKGRHALPIAGGAMLIPLVYSLALVIAGWRLTGRPDIRVAGGLLLLLCAIGIVAAALLFQRRGAWR